MKASANICKKCPHQKKRVEIPPYEWFAYCTIHDGSMFKIDLLARNLNPNNLQQENEKVNECDWILYEHSHPVPNDCPYYLEHIVTQDELK